MSRPLPLHLMPWLLLASACSGSEPSNERAVEQFGLPTPASATPAASGVPSAPEQNAATSETPAPAAPGATGNEGAPPVGGLTPPPASAPGGTGSGEVPATPPGMAMDPPPPGMQPTTPPPEPSFPPSQGCGNPNPATGAASLTIRGAQADYVVTLPAGYDPNTPTPLIFGFHGRNQTHVQFQTQDASEIQTQLGSRAIMAYLKSQGGPGWNFAAEVEPSVEFFLATYEYMLANYCVDPSRVFAAGHSSGGYFANILACRFPDRFRGIGSVAGATQECSGRVAAIVVHGIRDSVVAFQSGQASRDGYLNVNGCSAVSTPAAVEPCIQYSGCAAGFPVQWCEHNEPTYQNTNHGWPSFASRAMAEFFFPVP